MPARRARKPSDRAPVRYAVVGLGHIAQAAVLPAFAHAAGNSSLAALVSGDARKRTALGRKYGVRARYSYDEYESCLRSGEIDAVYLALPNHLHREYAVRAAEAGIHVLCEKPLAVTEADCEAMIRAAAAGGVRLMTAYRLRFDPANLSTLELVRRGRIGEPMLFNSTFTLTVRDGDIRLNPREAGGGTLYDIGVYCIDAARRFFAAEPEVVLATAIPGRSEARAGVEESVSATLRFPGGRLASFVVSFGAARVSSYRLVGTAGDVRLDPAYAYADEIVQTVTAGGRTRTRRFPKHDQFAAELRAFSDCVARGTEPESSGREGLAAVRVIRALYESARTGQPVTLPAASAGPASAGGPAS